MVEDKTMLKGGKFLANQNFSNTMSLLWYALRVTLPAFLARKKAFKKIYSSEFFEDLPDSRFAHLKRLLPSTKELKSSLLSSAKEYLTVMFSYTNKLSGLRVDYEDEKYSLYKIAKLFRDPQRDVRMKAWQASYGRLVEVQPKFNKVFSKLLKMRHKRAIKNGFDNARDYYHALKKRFDYTPDDCYTFHASVEEVIVPFVRELNEAKQKALELDDFRPWDKFVSSGKSPLKPYETIDELIQKMVRVFTKIKPEYGKLLDGMHQSGFIDPENRKGKVPGAMSIPLNDHRAGYIIANTVGHASDVMTIAHEGGHAMHWAAAADLNVAMYHEFLLFPMEIAEVGSMAMVFLIFDYLDEFYDDPADIKRAKLGQLHNAIRTLPNAMIIDAFQQWVYTHPKHSMDERLDYFKGLVDRFDGAAGVNYEGLDNEKGTIWLRYSHVFQSPFYYIEYAIAQLAALGIYRNYRDNQEDAIQKYDDFIHLGNSKPMPEVYKAAGVQFNFSKGYIKEILDFVKREIKILM